MTLESKTNLRKLRTEKVDQRVTLNVSGRRYCTWNSTLKKYPNTLLGSDAIKVFFDKDRKEYFLDRDPHMFRYILNFYRDGKFHLSSEDCVGAFREELSFYGIKDESIYDCCLEEFNNLISKTSKNDQETKECDCAEFRRSRNRSFLRNWLWNLLDNTETTFLGKCVQGLIVILIYLSIVSTIVETERCCEELTFLEKYPNIFFTFDAVCIAVFTLEYILRLYAAENRWEFIINKMNFVDLLAVAPFYVILLFEQFSPSSSSAVENASALMVLRMLRVFRIFKLSRHSKHMRQMGRALKRAVFDLGFLFFAFLLLNILFSSMMYYVEQTKSEETQFKSIPESMWYSTITMMTVGYGDMIPITIIGKILGSVCCLSGIIMLTLPIPIIQERTAKIKES